MLCFCSNRSTTLVAMVAYSSHKDLLARLYKVQVELL